MKYNINPGMIGISQLVRELDGTIFSGGISVEPYSQVSCIVEVQPEDTLVLIELMNKYSLSYSVVKEI